MKTETTSHADRYIESVEKLCAQRGKEIVELERQLTESNAAISQLNQLLTAHRQIKDMDSKYIIQLEANEKAADECIKAAQERIKMLEANIDALIEQLAEKAA